jgi:hypothetical protein
LALPTQLRKGGAVDPLCADDVNVIELGELLRSECLGRSEDHVAGIVNYHVQHPVLGDDFLDRRVAGFLRRDIQLDGTEIDPVLGRVGGLDVSTFATRQGSGGQRDSGSFRLASPRL